MTTAGGVGATAGGAEIVEIGLNAAIVAVAGGSPLILVVSAEGSLQRDGLPFGPFDPARHRTFETSLRDSVEKQTALSLGYIEQLYTFGDRGRHGCRARPPSTWSPSAISR